MSDGNGVSAPEAAQEPTVSAGVLLGIFLASAATLQLEILQTRIFSVLLWHHVTYLVVTFTLLGFAASGTLLSLCGGLVQRRPATFLATCSLLFAGTTLLAFQVLGRSELDTFELLKNRSEYFKVFAYYLYLVVPFIFAGLVIVGGLQVAGRKTGVLYASNLAGSAIGCLLFAFALSRLGGEGSVFLGAGLASAAGLCFALADRGLPRVFFGGITAALAVALFVLIPKAEQWMPFRAAPTKVMVELMNASRDADRTPEVLTTEWDPLCRIDVVDLDDDGPLAVYQDADAPTSIHAGDKDLAFLSIYNLPYLVRKEKVKEPKVLVIGVGGGQDIRYALANGASAVTGVEINETTARLMQTEYREFSGNIYNAPPWDGAKVADGWKPVDGSEKVTIEVTEGRSFVRRTDDQYSLIQMTGTDTYAALSSGSYVLSESYLYTVDAFRDYFEHLEPGGMISVLRFRFYPPRETLRLISIAVEAMRERGVERPEECVLVVDQAHFQPDPSEPDDRSKDVRVAYSVMLFKEEPFSANEVQTARLFVDQNAELRALAYAPGHDGDEAFDDFFASVADGTEVRFGEEYPYKIRPVDDDSPFFFNFHRLSALFGQRETPESTRGGDENASYLGVIGDDPVGLLLLGTALLESTGLVVLLVLLPLLLSRRTRLPKGRRFPTLLYFMGIGVGFLFLEIACMQKLILYLGHPTRSITVVLFTFLFFSGVGSFLAARLGVERAARGALVAIVALIAIYAMMLEPVLDATLGWTTNARIGCAVGLLAIPSFFMGMPFPGAVARLRGSDAPFVPWVFAINGGASVVASVAAVFLAMAFGFTAVFWFALGFYLLALLVEPRLPAPAG